MPTLIPNDMLQNRGFPFAHFQDQKADGVAGGNATAGTWVTRDLNATLANEIGASLSSNQITLQPGSYYVAGMCPSYRTNGLAARLYNVTSSSTIVLGPNTYNGSADTQYVVVHVGGKFTLTTTSVIVLQMISMLGTASGLGGPISTGLGEIYSDLKIWRTA